MIGQRSIEQRRDLGDFVRAQREKLTPAAAGLAGAGARRRTPGLRREEVAQLCGLSTTWYTWIEQGRDVSVSPVALARLADALRLGRAERAYLFELAGKRDPKGDGDGTDDVPAVVLACVEAIGFPAYVLDRTWTARGWNTQAQRLFVGWLDSSAGERNLLRFASSSWYPLPAPSSVAGRSAPAALPRSSAPLAARTSMTLLSAP